MAVGVVAVSERAANGGPLLLAGEDENIVHVAPGMSVVFGDAAPQQPGTLYVTTRRLIWLSDNDNQKGYAVDFRSLSMHAISRDPDAYPVPCIYTQIANDDEEHWDEMDEIDEEPLEAENHVEINLSTVEEMRLVPRDANTLDQLFQVLCDCALLNPDSDGAQEGEAEWFFNENEVLGRGPTGGNEISDIPNLTELHIQDPRFEDAEEDQEGDETGNR